MDGQVTWLDLGFSFGRTLSEHSAATEEKTSQPCWKKLRVSQNQDFLYLDCRTSKNGQKQEPLTVMGGLSLGELTTLKTGEKPSETAVQEMLSVWGPHSVAEESRLSQILEVNPLPKYNLTAKACLGILRRAERRGKDLPERLKAVLLMQSASGGGCDGGGKGALVQTEKSGTLGTSNDQTIFAPTAYSFDSLASNSMKSKNPNSGCRETEIAKTLDTTNPDPSKNQGGIAVVAFATNQRDEVRDLHDVAGALGAQPGMKQQTFIAAGFKLGNSEKAHSIGYEEETSPTLNAECGGNKPAVVALDMTHACDVIRECGEQVPALQARMGTGGNQVPLTYQMNGFGDYRAAEVASSCKQRDFKDSTDLAITHMVVRRLTPMECERLQGFPDHWTDIGEWSDEKGKKHKDADSPRCKALGNSIALPFWDWMLRRMARYLPEGATLGSLFDGIGGFPLIWERIHGKGTARWASEIEPFPIAVTKKHFPEEK